MNETSFNSIHTRGIQFNSVYRGRAGEGIVQDDYSHTPTHVFLNMVLDGVMKFVRASAIEIGVAISKTHPNDNHAMLCEQLLYFASVDHYYGKQVLSLGARLQTYYEEYNYGYNTYKKYGEIILKGQREYGQPESDMLQMYELVDKLLHNPTWEMKLIRCARCGQQRYCNRHADRWLCDECINAYLLPAPHPEECNYGKSQLGERAKMTASLRWKILERDGFRCNACGVTATTPNTILHVDHIVPIAHGGLTLESNLQVLCAKCNLGKSSKMPLQATLDLSAQNGRE